MGLYARALPTPLTSFNVPPPCPSNVLFSHFLLCASASCWKKWIEPPRRLSEEGQGRAWGGLYHPHPSHKGSSRSLGEEGAGSVVELPVTTAAVSL